MFGEPDFLCQAARQLSVQCEGGTIESCNHLLTTNSQQADRLKVHHAYADVFCSMNSKASQRFIDRTFDMLGSRSNNDSAMTCEQLAPRLVSPQTHFATRDGFRFL